MLMVQGRCIRVVVWMVYSTSALKLSRPKNLTLNSNNVRVDEFIDPGLQQFKGQTTHKNGEKYTKHRIISAGVTRFLEKTDLSRKKIAQDLHIDFVPSRYKYNCTVYI